MIHNSSYTGRAPRTMSAAFGPYITSNALQPLPGNPLTDAREQRRQTNALRLQMNDQTGYYK